jgi:hypothetical protein
MKSSASLYSYKDSLELTRIADFISIYAHQSALSYYWQALFFASPNDAPFTAAEEYSAELNEVSERVIEFANLACNREDISRLTCTIIIGRRKMLSPKDRKLILSFRPQNLNATIEIYKEYGSYEKKKQPVDVSLRTYDWLLELA